MTLQDRSGRESRARITTHLYGPFKKVREPAIEIPKAETFVMPTEIDITDRLRESPPFFSRLLKNSCGAFLLPCAPLAPPPT